MKKHQNRTRKFSRRQWRRVILRREVVACLLVLLILAVAGAWWFVVHPENTNSDDERYRFIDSKYIDVRREVVTRESQDTVSIIEYPITKNERINSTLRDYIDSHDNDTTSQHFHAVDSGRRPTHHITFQVVQQNERYISIVITSYQQTKTIYPLQETEYWTFDKRSGEVIPFYTLFSYVADGASRSTVYILQKLQRSLGPLGGYDEARALKSIYLRMGRSFIWQDSQTLRFDFDRGEVAIPHFEPQSITISVDSLQMYMQTDISRSLFSVVDLEPSPLMANRETKSERCMKEKCIALTFDDGPSSNTTQLLDILKRYDAHATFFMIGENIKKRPGLVKKISNASHTIGSHGWDHRSFSTLSQADIVHQIERTNREISTLSQQPVKYVRPPNGALSQHTLNALAMTKMTGILWSLDTRDWATTDSRLISARVISGASPNDIVILHDTRRSSFDAVASILETLSRRGYQFVSLDELFEQNITPGTVIYSIE